MIKNNYHSKPLQRQKKVRFSDNLEEVFILPVELSSDKHTESNNDSISTSTITESDARKTSQITLLSSLHGEARRELRNISKFDLQSAVKYGIKTRAHNCRKTKMPRWKFVYGNIVYITDHTCKKEITSYKQAISITPATITPEMEQQHELDTQTLEDDPQLCATHSIVIIDQSGSMKNSDVKGFRNRSEAAYGVLALEFIAEQLHARGEEKRTLDAISIIEMNEVSSVIFQREPLDWIFFNKVLKRQKSAKPRSHGNYNHAIKEAKNLIDRELSFMKESHPDDLPSFPIIFLSDGKPSDNSSLDTTTRDSLLSNLGLQMKSSLQFHGIGIGQSSADFSALEDMVSTMQYWSEDSSFSFSRPNCSQLSSAFSTISATVTATRTDRCSSQINVKSLQKKNVELRSKYTAKADRIFEYYSKEVSRWEYDHDKYKAGSDWPWTKVAFLNRKATAIAVENVPFGKGAERLAHMFHEIDNVSNKKKLGNSMVAKETIHLDDVERRVNFHETFCRVQKKASDLADAFNRTLKITPSLQPTDESLKIPLVTFLRCYVYEYEDENGENSGMLVEKFLKGKFTKFNSNNGYVKETDNEPSLDLQVGQVYVSDFLQAFSHWVYHHTDNQILLCDLQGVYDEEGYYPKFLLTDPCICSRVESNRKRCYGASDVGSKGFRSFHASHKCNNVCRGLGLEPFGMKSRKKRRIALDA